SRPLSRRGLERRADGTSAPHVPRASARMNPVSLRDPHEPLLHVTSRFAERGADSFDLGELVALERKAMRRERVFRVLHETAAKLRVFYRAADDRADHFIAHSMLPPCSRGSKGPAEMS